MPGQQPAVADAAPLLQLERAADLDLQSLSDLLQRSGRADGLLVAMDVRPVGNGLQGSSTRLALRYAAGARGPAAIILKMHNEEASGRKMGRYGYRIPDDLRYLAERHVRAVFRDHNLAGRLEQVDPRFGAAARLACRGAAAAADAGLVRPGFGNGEFGRHWPVIQGAAGLDERRAASAAREWRVHTRRAIPN